MRLAVLFLANNQDFLNGKGSFVQHVYFSQMKMYLIFQLEELLKQVE